MELIGVFFIASGLLVLAGIAKGIRPDDTARALVLLLPERSAFTPSFTMARRGVRIGAVTEAAVGAVALFFPQPATALLVAASYLLFVGVVVSARTQEGALSTCGCFGRPDTPATGLHVLLNVVFLATAVGVALHPPHYSSLVPMLANQPWSGVPILLASGAGVWLTFLALAPLAALEAARRMTTNAQREASSI